MLSSLNTSAKEFCRYLRPIEKLSPQGTPLISSGIGSMMQKAETDMNDSKLERPAAGKDTLSRTDVPYLSDNFPPVIFASQQKHYSIVM